MARCADTAAGRKRKHVEKMLARAEQRERRAARLVEKWQSELKELDRQWVAEIQLSLLEPSSVSED
jgi:hypothetical protein